MHVPFVVMGNMQGATACYIDCKTLFAERDKLPLKLTCPVTLLNKGEIGHCPKYKLLQAPGKSVSFSACPIVVFCRIYFQLATGHVVSLLGLKKEIVCFL